MTIFLIILEIILVLVRALMAYFVESTKWLEPLQTPLTVICVIMGIVAVAFVGARFYKELRGGKRGDGE